MATPGCPRVADPSWYHTFHVSIQLNMSAPQSKCFISSASASSSNSGKTPFKMINQFIVLVPLWYCICMHTIECKEIWGQGRACWWTRDRRTGEENFRHKAKNTKPTFNFFPSLPYFLLNFRRPRTKRLKAATLSLHVNNFNPDYALEYE